MFSNFVLKTILKVGKSITSIFDIPKLWTCELLDSFDGRQDELEYKKLRILVGSTLQSYEVRRSTYMFSKIQLYEKRTKTK